MVSIGSYLSLGALAIAVIGFYKLGGASGIGSRVGTGLTDFTYSLFNPFDNNTKPPTQSPAAPPTQGPAQSPPQDERVDPENDWWSWVPNVDIPAIPGIIPPIAFGDGPNTKPDNFMDQFTWTDRTPTPEPAPAMTYGPLPPFAGTLEHVVRNMTPTQGPTQGPTQTTYSNQGYQGHGTINYGFLDNLGV